MAFSAPWCEVRPNSMDVVLGIDTSCYTTSVAALDTEGGLTADLRIPLVVKPGGRGLSQSEMVFQHMRNLPVLMRQLRQSIGEAGKIAAIGATTRPRSVDGSYMPAFLAGSGLAASLGAALVCPVIELSHQENHLLAGLWSAGRTLDRDFLTAHVSGGTTEILQTIATATTLEVQLLGGSDDLHAGQFIDRVGVALGLSFPAGPQLEKLAEECKTTPASTPVSVNGLHISFSGPESHVMRWLATQPEPAEVAASVQECIAASLAGALSQAVLETGRRTVLLVGGVAANRFIRSRVAESLQNHNVTVVWPEPRFSGDNAAGAACRALTLLGRPA